MKYIAAAYMMIVLMLGAEELSTFRAYCSQDSWQLLLHSGVRLLGYLVAFSLATNMLLSIWRDQVVEEAWDIFHDYNN